MTENPATRACVLGIEAYERLLNVDGASKPFEGHVVSRGVELLVSGPRGTAEGRLSALWLLAARATGGGPPPNLRFFTPLAPRTPEDLNREVAAALFRAALFYADAGEKQEALLCMRRATHGCASHDGWLAVSKLPKDLLDEAPKGLLDEAGGATKLERAVGEKDTTVPALAKKVVPFAADADVLVRHDCAGYLTWAASSILNSSAAPFAKTVAPALDRLLDDRCEYVKEQAYAAAELTARALAQQADDWRRSHKSRLATVSALKPLATRLMELGIDRDHQARRLLLDGTPRAPDPGNEKGPWGKEALEAIKILSALEKGRKALGPVGLGEDAVRATLGVA